MVINSRNDSILCWYSPPAWRRWPPTGFTLFCNAQSTTSEISSSCFLLNTLPVKSSSRTIITSSPLRWGPLTVSIRTLATFRISWSEYMIVAKTLSSSHSSVGYKSLTHYTSIWWNTMSHVGARSYTEAQSYIQLEETMKNYATYLSAVATTIQNRSYGTEAPWFTPRIVNKSLSRSNHFHTFNRANPGHIKYLTALPCWSSQSRTSSKPARDNPGWSVQRQKYMTLLVLERETIVPSMKPGAPNFSMLILS